MNDDARGPTRWGQQNLGQPRWYRMTVTVERSGRFSADVAYQDRYTTGDVMRPA